MKKLADNFWNFRGEFRLGGLIDIGTHMSLVRRSNGRFLLLDSYALDANDLGELNDLTGGGEAIEAILNVHPFHTIHCEAVARQFPRAKMIGTLRHKQKCPSVSWADACIEDPLVQQQFSDDLDFSVPDGVDFISDNEKVHVSSVLVRHRASRIVHVDDTLNVIQAPSLLKPILPNARLRFHMMLSKALKKEAPAADAYEAWARQLAADWADTQIVCTAHSAVHRLGPATFSEELIEALRAVEGTLDRHRRQHR